MVTFQADVATLDSQHSRAMQLEKAIRQPSILCIGNKTRNRGLHTKRSSPLNSQRRKELRLFMRMQTTFEAFL